MPSRNGQGHGQGRLAGAMHLKVRLALPLHEPLGADVRIVGEAVGHGGSPQGRKEAAHRGIVDAHHGGAVEGHAVYEVEERLL